LEHILNFDEPLSELVRKQPVQVIPAFERSIEAVYRNHYMTDADEGDVAPKF
jgi:DNA replication licensing factor MCM5